MNPGVGSYGMRATSAGDLQPVHGCRFCSAPLSNLFVDLGMSPLCESYRSLSQMDEMEPFYPLRVYVCSECYLVQLPKYVGPDDIFSEYAYFSSYSDSWLEHAERYVEMIVKKFNITGSSQVVEIASNDGYLLQYFTQRNIPVLGIEPASNVARAAISKGIPTRVMFFGSRSATELVREGIEPDLIVGNNVLAHVPDINDFVSGLKLLLSPRGIITMEFPHLMRLIEGNQFDTIYHEHFSYFSFSTVERIFAAHGLALFDVEELPTHGGSLRIYARHKESLQFPVSARVADLRDCEKAAGYESIPRYFSFGEKVKTVKRDLLAFLIEARRQGKSIAGYGAPGKGNTLLNYCGIRTDLLDYTVDRNPYKHGRCLPGTGIPIFPIDHIAQTRPDYVLILPWNLKDEILRQMKHIRVWGGKFVIPIPELEVN